MNALSNFAFTVDKSKVIYFFQAQWQAVRVVWGLVGALATRRWLCVTVQLRGIGQ